MDLGRQAAYFHRLRGSAKAPRVGQDGHQGVFWFCDDSVTETHTRSLDRGTYGATLGFAFVPFKVLY